MTVVGIDLAGKPTNPTGIAVINDKAITKEVRTDEEILSIIDNYKPKIVAIDAPFSVPKDEAWRSSDYALRERGYGVLSPKFPAMQMLSNRAQKLIEALRKKHKVIEVFPRAAEEILGIEKTTIEKKLDKILTDHEYDAFLCCLTAKAHLERKTVVYGNPADMNDQIVVPEKE